jgi:hypothetical protein
LATSVSEFFTAYYPLEANNNTSYERAFEAIDRVTSRDSVLVTLGLDWDSTFPYYTHRRALMIPQWKYVTEANVEDALRSLKGEEIGAVIIVQPVGGNISPTFLIEKMKSYGLDTRQTIVFNRTQ